MSSKIIRKKSNAGRKRKMSVAVTHGETEIISQKRKKDLELRSTPKAGILSMKRAA